MAAHYQVMHGGALPSHAWRRITKSCMAAHYQVMHGGALPSHAWRRITKSCMAAHYQVMHGGALPSHAWRRITKSCMAVHYQVMHGGSLPSHAWRCITKSCMAVHYQVMHGGSSLHCTCLSHNHNSAAPSAPLHGNRPPTAQPHCSPSAGQAKAPSPPFPIPSPSRPPPSPPFPAAHLLLPRQRLPHGSLPLHHPPPSAAPVAPILTSGLRISGLMVRPHSSHPCTVPSSPLPTSSNPSPVCLPTSSALHLLLQHWFLVRISRPCSTMQAEAADVAEAPSQDYLKPITSRYLHALPFPLPFPFPFLPLIPPPNPFRYPSLPTPLEPSADPNRLQRLQALSCPDLRLVPVESTWADCNGWACDVRAQASPQVSSRTMASHRLASPFGMVPRTCRCTAARGAAAVMIALSCAPVSPAPSLVVRLPKPSCYPSNHDAAPFPPSVLSLSDPLPPHSPLNSLPHPSAAHSLLAGFISFSLEDYHV
ncbi:unnamed protein product [Closterium sp. NIES-54]